MHPTRLLGALLMMIAFSIALFFMLQMREGNLRPSGVLFGTFLFGVPLISAGLALWFKGAREQAGMDRVEQQKELLGLVDTRGKISFGEACGILKVPPGVLEEHLRDLTAKGLFLGSIHWGERQLRSHEAAHAGGRCGHCGGELDLAGKGVIECEYCGSNHYLGAK